ncbi:MAG: glycosidase [Chlorobi bacterium]|nr:glycosidase [Chlorobiota bacterium]
MTANPRLYEINTRVWIRQFDKAGQKAKLSNIPDTYWDYLRELGVDFVWLMGIWKISKSAVQRYAFEDELTDEYERALKDWTEEDVIGSPYAIDVYDVNYDLGNLDDLLNLKSKLNERGMKLILDYVPNHFSAESILIRTHPDIFLYTDEKYYYDDPHTFFKPYRDSKFALAHGRDPFYPAWQDTVQVNYFSVSARDFMLETLIRLTRVADGLRCDMAMLALNNVFKNTWGGVLETMKVSEPKNEFWKIAIDYIKKEREDFIFIGEVYWDLEWKLQQLGFDYTYDKKLTERIVSGNVHEIRSHLHADPEYRMKSVRFIENHDEERSIKVLGKEKALAAATIIGTIDGMDFYYDGQLEGKTVKLPVQLGRAPKEKVGRYVKSFYEKFLKLTSEEIFKNGEWTQLTPESAGDGDRFFKNILCWQWTYQNERRLIVINFSSETSGARIIIDVADYSETILFDDMLNNKSYKRKKSEIEKHGLYVKLKPYRSHIFKY